MKRKKFLDLLKQKKVFVFDGAMGTMIYNKGVPKGHCYDELNLSNPDLIKGILLDYLEAGADIITTNTFGANRYILNRYYDLGDSTKDINVRGAEIAKEIARDKFVAGSVGPVSRPAEIYTELSDSEVEEILKEQVESLIEGGVDLIIFETFSSLGELKAGIKVARFIDSDIPIIAEMTFPTQERTITGVTPHQAGFELDKTEADVIGVNCGTGPKNSLAAIKKVGEVSSKFLSAMPNAGFARFNAGKFSYPFQPDYFARYAKKFLHAGVSIIGGCCGTTPEHIRAIKQATHSLKPLNRAKVFVSIKEQTFGVKKVDVETTFRSLLKHKFTVSVEIDPPKGPFIENTLSKIKKIRGFGVDAINVSDSPMARLRMSPGAFASLIMRELDLEVILHLTCRDRNLLGLQSDLLGYAGLGIENILAITGDSPSLGDYPFATGVYDVTSKGLVSMINNLNQGRDFLGNPIEGKTNLCIGIGSPSNPENGDKELRIVEDKVKKGAHFIQTQPIFDVLSFQDFYNRLSAFNLPIIVGLLPPITASSAEFFAYEVPGMKIPPNIIDRLKRAKNRYEENEIGIAISREILKEIKDMGASGVCLMIPGRKYEILESILN